MITLKRLIEIQKELLNAYEYLGVIHQDFLSSRLKESQKAIESGVRDKIEIDGETISCFYFPLVIYDNREEETEYNDVPCTCYSGKELVMIANEDIIKFVVRECDGYQDDDGELLGVENLKYSYINLEDIDPKMDMIFH